MRVCSIAVAALVLVLASHAYAEPDPTLDARAASAFEEGTEAFHAGDFVRAADAFERANSIRPHHDALWNAARARERSGANVRAANLYARYLREAPPSAPDRDTAISSLTALAKTLGRIELHAEAGVSNVRLDGAPFELVEELWVSPGEHVFDAEAAAAGPIKRTVVVEAGSVVSVTLRTEAATATPTPTPAKRSFPWTVVVSGGIATLALGAVTTWSAFDTVAQKKAFNENRSQENLDEGRSRMVRTNVLLGITSGVLVITGAVTAFMVLTARPKSSTAAIRIGPGSVGFEGTF